LCSTCMIVLSVYAVYIRHVRRAANRRRAATGSQRLWDIARVAFIGRMAVDWDASQVGVAPFASFDEPPTPSPTRGGHSKGVLGGSRTRPKPRLSVEGLRAISYLLAAVLAWALLGGSFALLPTVDKGAVGLLLVIALYAPRPVGVADVAELRTAKSYGAVIYLCAVLALQTAVDKVGLTAQLADAVSSLSLSGLPPMMQYLTIAWSIAALTLPTNEVLAAVIGSSVWLSYVVAPGYDGPLTPLRVALACCCPGCLCLTPTHCPPVVVGLGMAKATGGVGLGRLYALMLIQTVVEVVAFYPLAIAIILAVT